MHMSLENPVTEGFVLAGGNSSRMGQDKSLLRVAGLSLLEWALNKLRTLPLTIPPRIAGARSSTPLLAPVVSDIHPGCGPLSGIEAALAATNQNLNIFLPVDMPLVPPSFLTWMLHRAQTTAAFATIPRINGLAQPLCAIYHRHLLEPVSAALAEGDWKVMPTIHAAAGPGGIDLFDVERVVSSDFTMAAFSPLPLYRWFHNCNSPGDMTGLEDALVLIP
jgi:molybdenum cofactor guanylyltransferase